MGTRRTDDRERQVEERLAVLLRPGPRRARVPPVGDPDVDAGGDPDVEDTLIGDRPTEPPPGHTVGSVHGAYAAGWLDEKRDRREVTEQINQQKRVDGEGGDWNELDDWNEFDDAGVGEAGSDRNGLDRDGGEWRSSLRSRAGGLVGGLRQMLPVGSLAGFGGQQLAVIAVIVALGVLFGGWAVLRARPVAIGAPRLTAATGSPASDVAKSPSATTHGPSASTKPASTNPTSADGTGRASPASSSMAATIRVHVLGAVRKSGVVSLPLGARVQDAIQRAGGTKKSARLGDLNLAQPLTDGQQVFIGHGTRDSAVRNPTTGPPIDPTGAPATGAAQPAGPLDLNTATLDQLDTLPGIGPVTAQKILDWRTEHGKFNSIDELQEVAGIGPKTFADLKSAVTV